MEYKCEECRDTGYVGDTHAGRGGYNKEYMPCECEFGKTKIDRSASEINVEAVVIPKIADIDTFELAEKIQRWIGEQKFEGTNILDACVCCDHVGRMRFIKGIKKIIDSNFTV